MLATFFIELVGPGLLLLPMGWARALGFALTSWLMGLIVLTGNYGFFNWLTVALTLPVLHDAQA